MTTEQICEKIGNLHTTLKELKKRQNKWAFKYCNSMVEIIGIEIKKVDQELKNLYAELNAKI